MFSQEIPAKNLAALLDLSVARVGQLAKEGVIPRLPSRKYPAAAITEYVRYLRKTPHAGNELREEIDREKHRALKRENDIAEKLVAPVQDLGDALTRICQRMVPLLEALPLQMKRMNPRLTGHDIQTVTKCIARCRNAMAETYKDGDDE